MVRLLPGCAFVKIGDFGNSVPSCNDRRVGDIYTYMAPENVIGLGNGGFGGDTFAPALVFVEVAYRSIIMPESRELSYGEVVEGTCSDGALRRIYSLHLVLMSSLIEQRPVYADLVVRRYHGNISKERTSRVLISRLPDFDRHMHLMIVSGSYPLHNVRSWLSNHRRQRYGGLNTQTRGSLVWCE